MAIKLGDALFLIKANNKDLVEKFKESEDQSEKSTSKISKSLDILGKSFLAAGVLAGAAIAKLTVDGVRDFIELEAGIANVVSLFGVSGEKAEQMKKDFTEIARPIAIQFGQELPDVVQGMYDAISAEVPRENIASFLSDAARVAVASGTTIETSVDLLTSIINAYGGEAGDANEISGKLIKTVAAGKTDFNELAASFSTVGSTAAGLNIGLSDILASTAALTLKGAPTSQAFTRLNAIISALINPTAEAAKAAEKLEIQLGPEAFKTESLIGKLKQIKKGTDSSEVSFTEFFTATEALSGAMAITSDVGEKATNIFFGIDDAVSSLTITQTNFEQKSKTLAFKLSVLKAVMKDQGIIIATALEPALKKLVDATVILFTEVITLEKGFAKTSESFGFAQDSAEAFFTAVEKKGVFQAILDEVNEFSDLFGPSLVSAFDVADQLFQKGKDLGKSLIDGILNKLGALGDKIASVIPDWIVDLLTSGDPSALLGTSVVQSITGALGAAGQVLSDIFIPESKQAGGLITGGNIGDSKLIRAHVGEFVQPAGGTQGGGNGGGGVQIQQVIFNLPATQDPNAMAQILQQSLDILQENGIGQGTASIL